MRAKKLGRFFDRHLHHVTDALSVIENFERLRIVTAPVAIFAWHIAARQKIHLELDHALAFAGFTTSAFRVKRKPAGRITAHARDGKVTLTLADLVEDFDVGRRRGTRRLA